MIFDINRNGGKMKKRPFLIHLVIFTFLLTALLALTTQAAAETIFTHPDISFSLPEGWSSQEIPANFEKETIAWLKTEKIAGTSIMVFCYKGWRYNYSAVRVAGLKTIASSYPKGQEVLKKEEKLRTDSGLKAVWEYWRGGVDAGGQTVFLESPMGIIAAKSGWILMLGFTPASSGPQLEEDFMKILKSAK
jgi:hypothetical protein